MKRISWIVIAFALCCLLGISCQREPLHDIVYDKAFELVVKPRWTELDERPTGMTVIAYPTNGNKPVTTISANVDSVSLALPPGGYRILLFNGYESEYSSFYFRHIESFADCEIVANEDADNRGSYSILPASIMSKQPEILATSTSSEVYVSQDEIDLAYSRNRRLVKTVTMVPHIIISTLYITVPVDGAYNAYTAFGCIDGMSRHIYPTYYEAGPNLASHAIYGWEMNYESLSSNFGTLTVKCTTMGMPGRPLFVNSTSSIETNEYPLLTNPFATKSEMDPMFKPEDIRLHMRVLLVDKKTVVDTTYLVGDIIERRINSPLILELKTEAKMKLPYVKPADGSGAAGFIVSVDDWNDIEEQINF